MFSECKSAEDCGLKARCDSKLEKCACEQGYEGDPDVKCERKDYVLCSLCKAILTWR